MRICRKKNWLPEAPGFDQISGTVNLYFLQSTTTCRKRKVGDWSIFTPLRKHFQMLAHIGFSKVTKVYHLKQRNNSQQVDTSKSGMHKLSSISCSLCDIVLSHDWVFLLSGLANNQKFDTWSRKTFKKFKNGNYKTMRYRLMCGALQCGYRRLLTF